MKSTIIILLLFAIITILISSRCSKCHQCIAKGQNFNLPYSKIQTVTFINDSLVKQSLLVTISGTPSPPQFCGDVEEVQVPCSGYSGAILTTNNSKTSVISISKTPIQIGEDWNGDPQNIVTEVVISNGAVDINYDGSTSASLYYRSTGTITTGASLTINGTTYSNLYVYQNDTAAINGCPYFVYSITNGVLKYSIKKATYTENWTLVQ